MDEIIVIGHRRPDVDSVAAAAGYAALLAAQGRPARAARCGPLDAQSELALARFGVAAPDLVLDVAPTFGRIARRVEPLAPAAPLSAAIAAIAAGGRAVPVVGAEGRPVALLDADACVRRIGRGARQDEPCVVAPGGPPPAAFLESERVSDRRAFIARAEPDDYLVVDAGGRYAGVATRAAVLAPPRPRLALVDHNEIEQAVPGADEAEIVEVLDHHRLGAAPTREPIPFAIEVVGSTATLVEERWTRAARPLPPGLAGLLLAGVLSDTLAFRSPTTTARDEAAARRLAAAAGVPDLAAFGEELLAAAAGLGRRPADEIVGEDFKEYRSAAGPVLIAQAEVKNFAEVAARRDDLAVALERLRDWRGARLALLLLTDAVRGRSRAIAAGEPGLLARLPYPRAPDGTLDAGLVVSRKKEVVPAVLAALE